MLGLNKSTFSKGETNVLWTYKYGIWYIYGIYGILFQDQEKNYYETGRWAEIAAAALIRGCWWDAGTCLSASPGSNIKSMAALGLFWCWEFMGVRNEDDCDLQEHTAQHSGEL